MQRRDFLKGAGLVAGATIVDPSILMAKVDKNTGAPASEVYGRKVLDPEKYDVIVVGAGPGGIPAALRAAQNGARVALVEDDNFIGGGPVDMYVCTLFGGPNVGLAKQLGDTLEERASLYNYDSGTQPRGWRFYLPSSFIQVNTERVLAEKNITLITGTPVIGVHVKEEGVRNRVTGVRIFRGGALQDLMAAVTIDATGTGVVAAMAGCTCMYGSEARSEYNESYGFDEASNQVQKCTMMFISERIKKDAIFPAGFRGSAAEDGYVGANRLTAEELQRRATGIFFHWGQTVEVSDTRDPVAIAEAHRWCVNEYKERFKQLHEAGFAVHFAPKLGVREVRRVKGEYVMTCDDIINGNFPDDTIAHGAYSIDCWGYKWPRVDGHEVKPKVKPYGVPYRSLIPLGYEGILTAGRVISGTRMAHSSYRVQRICSNIGEGAGVAAAMAAKAKANLRDIDVEKLVATLGSYGVFDKYNQKK